MEPDNRPWVYKFNVFVMVLVGLGVVIWLARLAGAFSPVVVPIGALFWAYAVSVVILIEWAVLHFRVGKAPLVPLISRRLSGSRALLVGLCVYVAAFTLVREGALAPHFVLTVNQYSTNSNSRFDTQSSSSSQDVDGESVTLAGQPVFCLIDCTPLGSTLCETALSVISCDENASSESVMVQAHITLGEEPFCYFPFFKSSEVQFSATATISASTPAGATQSHSITINGETNLKMTGVGSCYTFRQILGAEIGHQVANAVTAVITSH